MPKTKEEVQKILEKNYQSVQVAELNVYDKNQAVKKQFDKEVKDLTTNLKTEVKALNDQQKQTKADFKTELDELVKKDKAHQEDILKRREQANDTYSKSIEAAQKKYDEEVKKQNQAIDEENKAYEKLVKSVLDEYNKNVAAAKKEIEQINEKGVKDQTVFASKLEDLKAKHEAKVAETNEKEQTKIEKLTEASNKEIDKQEDLMVSERKKLDDKLEALRPVYLEELEEINDNIEQKKNEYEEKHESIRSSADQRIAVREKHMHRAMDDNDSRSVKQHKKDIEKFRKEADRDLVTLRKNYKQEDEQAQEYRKNFIKENFEKLADLEREYKRFEEAKQKEIDELHIKHENDVKLTKLEFEQQQAELLQDYNSQFKEVRMKQEDVLRQQELDVEAQENKQVELKVEFDKTNKVNEDNHKLTLETRAKELRDAEIEKQKDEMLEKDVLDNEVAKLDNEKTVADLELAQDKDVLVEKEVLENHRYEQKHMSSYKEEFFGFQGKLEALYLDRASEVLVYEEQEIKNRYEIKLAFLNKQLEVLKVDYNALVAKIEDVYNKEKAPFVELVDKIAGEEKAELAELEQAHEEKISSMKEKLKGLHPRKNKKEIRSLEDEIDNIESNFKRTKAQKEADILANIKTYQNALDAAERRYNQALEEAKVLNDHEDQRLQKSIEMLEMNQLSELEDAKLRKTETESSVQDFISASATRNTLNTEDNQAYLSDLVEQDESRINARIQAFEADRENENNRFNSQIQELAQAKQAGLDKATSDFNQEESNLESFTNNIEAAKKQASETAQSELSAQQSATNSKNDTINSKYDSNQKSVENNLEKQSDEFKDHLNKISKEVSEANHHYESEQKRTHKEYEQRLKDGLQDIDAKLQTDTKNIQ